MFGAMAQTWHGHCNRWSVGHAGMKGVPPPKTIESWVGWIKPDAV